MSKKLAHPAKPLKPGENTGKNGGIYQERGPRGGLKENYTTVPDNRPMPPTTKPGHDWIPKDITPDSNRS